MAAYANLFLVLLFFKPYIYIFFPMNKMYVNIESTPRFALLKDLVPFTRGSGTTLDEGQLIWIVITLF